MLEEAGLKAAVVYYFQFFPSCSTNFISDVDPAFIRAFQFFPSCSEIPVLP